MVVASKVVPLGIMTRIEGPRHSSNNDHRYGESPEVRLTSHIRIYRALPYPEDGPTPYDYTTIFTDSSRCYGPFNPLFRVTAVFPPIMPHRWAGT